MEFVSLKMLQCPCVLKIRTAKSLSYLSSLHSTALSTRPNHREHSRNSKPLPLISSKPSEPYERNNGII
ncbi:hypothetical protein YC2023_030760 [Brassica napus]